MLSQMSGRVILLRCLHKGLRCHYSEGFERLRITAEMLTSDVDVMEQNTCGYVISVQQDNADSMFHRKMPQGMFNGGLSNHLNVLCKGKFRPLAAQPVAKRLRTSQDDHGEEALV